MRFAPLLASASVLVLSIISTTFVLLALTSKRWAVQNYYFSSTIGSEGDGSHDIDRVTFAYRSPFYKCGIPEVFENGTHNAVFCQFYKPYGKDATSCRTTGEMKIARNQVAISKGLLGSAQECQQVHYAGNLQIAASVFLTLALLLSLILCLLALKPRRQASTEPSVDHTEEAKTGAKARHTPAKGHNSKLSQKIVVLLLASLYIGAMLQIFAQFFGILGLTLNASPNGATANGDQPEFLLNNFDAADWIIDLALSRYATVAWTSALAAAAIATVIFTTPRSKKFY